MSAYVVTYRTRRGAGVSHYYQDLNSVADHLERLWKGRIPATARCEQDKRTVGEVCEMDGFLTWWSEIE